MSCSWQEYAYFQTKYLETTRTKDDCMLYYHSLSKFRNQGHVFQTKVLMTSEGR